ncbi:uncharacterized protein [Maniola hyperantus]|uniref:uncharacterized protein isoform X2 n=1 Tax=Aphantopus hyperantus TaxID=2795564 RepID=UPI0037490065
MVRKCVVPGCDNLGQHLFPKGNDRRSLWMKAMRLEGQIMKLKHPTVCTLHFKDTDYMDTEYFIAPQKRRHLKRHAIPSIFPWSDAPPTKQCAFISQEEINHSSDSETEMENIEPRDPLLVFTDDDNTTEKLSSEMGNDYEREIHFNVSGVNKAYNIMQHDNTTEKLSSEMGNDHEREIPFDVSGVNKTYNKMHHMPVQFIPELTYLPCQDRLQESERQHGSEARDYFAESEIDIGNTIEITESVVVKQEENSLHDNLENSFTITKTCASCGHVPFYSVHSYKNEPNGVHFYTGLETIDKLMFVFHSLGNGVNSLNYFYRLPPVHLDPLEQFCMTLLILRRHREFEDIAMTYKTSVKQVTNIFITWIRFMALQWRTIDLWINRDAVSYYMPLDFSDKYPDTRVIIDAIECPIQKPCLPTTQQITFSMLKNRNTVKLLIGIAPSGLITYISPCYGGSASDRQIIERSSILNKFEFNDEVMVNEGLNVQDIFLAHRVKVNMTTFSRKRNQILTRDRKIVSKRVHVERIIGMLKTYKILTQAMTQTETALASDITFIVAMLVNFRSDVIK